MKAEELLNKFESASRTLQHTSSAEMWKDAEKLRGELRAELLSRLSRVEELQQQVAELTEQYEALKESVLHDKSREELIADIAKALRLEFSPSYVEGPDAEFWIPAEPGPLGPFEDIVETCREFMLFFDKVDKMQRDALERAEAEAEKAKGERDYFDKLQADCSGKYAAETALRLDWQGRAENSERRIGVMREALKQIANYSRSMPFVPHHEESFDDAFFSLKELARAALTPEPAQSTKEEK